MEHIAGAPNLNDSVNQPVPLGGQGGRGKHPHLTLLDALAGMGDLPISTECGSLTGQGLHLHQQRGLVGLDLNDEVVAGRSRDLEGFF